MSFSKAILTYLLLCSTVLSILAAPTGLLTTNSSLATNHSFLTAFHSNINLKHFFNPYDYNSKVKVECYSDHHWRKHGCYCTHPGRDFPSEDACLKGIKCITDPNWKTGTFCQKGGPEYPDPDTAIPRSLGSDKHNGALRALNVNEAQLLARKPKSGGSGLGKSVGGTVVGTIVSAAGQWVGNWVFRCHGKHCHKKDKPLKKLDPGIAELVAVSTTTLASSM